MPVDPSSPAVPPPLYVPPGPSPPVSKSARAKPASGRATASRSTSAPTARRWPIEPSPRRSLAARSNANRLAHPQIGAEQSRASHEIVGDPARVPGWIQIKVAIFRLHHVRASGSREGGPIIELVIPVQILPHRDIERSPRIHNQEGADRNTQRSQVVSTQQKAVTNIEGRTAIIRARLELVRRKVGRTGGISLG